MSNVWPSINGFTDGDALLAENLNDPIYKLAQRTATLRNMLANAVNDANGNSYISDIPLSMYNTPGILDVVNINNDGMLVRAIQTLDSLGQDNQAIGILTAVEDGKGTVIIKGNLTVSIDDFAAMFDDDIAVIGYLSRITAGKLTSTPGSNGYKVVTAIAKDNNSYVLIVDASPAVYTGHTHTTMMMHGKPVGSAYLNEDEPIVGFHSINGYYPDSVDPGSIEIGDYVVDVPRLIVSGSWKLRSDVTITLWLSNLAGASLTENSAPGDWLDTYLHWTTDSPDVPNGFVRVTGYHIPVAIGATGIIVALDIPTKLDNSDYIDHNLTKPCYLDLGANTITSRTWTLQFPSAGQGWGMRRYDAKLVANQDNGFDFIIFGKYTTDSAVYRHNEINIACLYTYELDMTDFNTAGSRIILMYANGTSQTFHIGATDVAGYVAVAWSADAEVTLKYLTEAIKSLSPNIVIARRYDSTEFIIGSDHANTKIKVITDGGAVTDYTTPNNGAAGTLPLSRFLVYDEHGVILTANQPLYEDAQSQVLNNPLISDVKLYVAAYDSSPNPPTIGYLARAKINNTAPGAVFYYVSGMHPGMASIYPSVPVTAVRLEMNGVQLDEYSTGQSTYSYTAGIDTLYWHTDAYESVPWPARWRGPDYELSPWEYVRLLLHVTYVTHSSGEVVSSLRPAPGAPVMITRCGTADGATTGDLEINVNLDINTYDVNKSGYRVVKSVKGNQAHTGPIVERIIPGPGIIVTQNYGAPTGQGIVQIGLASDSVYTGDFDIITLENAKQDRIGLFTYMKLLGWQTGAGSTVNIPTAFTAQVRIPHNIENRSYKMIIYATVFGTANGDDPGGESMFAGLTLDYAAVHDLYISDGSPVGSNMSFRTTDIKPAEPRYAEIMFPAGYASYDPIIVHNSPDEINVGAHYVHALGELIPDTTDLRPGSIIAVRFARGGITISGGASKLEYNHPIGFVNLRWLLTTV